MPLPPIPRFNALLANVKTLLVSFQWDNWLQAVVNKLNAAPEAIGTLTLSAQSASVGATAINSTTLAAGLYRVNVYARISRAASVSSSLAAVIGWTDGGVACSTTAFTLTGNTTATHGEVALPIQVDASTNVTYTLTYASSGATTMQYGMRAALEAL